MFLIKHHNNKSNEYCFCPVKVDGLSTVSGLSTGATQSGSLPSGSTQSLKPQVSSNQSQTTKSISGDRLSTPTGPTAGATQPGLFHI